MIKKSVPYAIYARKSTEGEDRQVQSIDAQLFELKKIAKSEGLNVVEVFEESKSAKLPFQRPKFAQMLKMIEKGEIKGILVWQLNRISRNPAESGMIQQLLQDGKIQKIRTYDRSYEPEDNAVIFSVEASISNQFIMDLRKSVKRGIREKVRNGGISGPALEGYINVIDPVTKVKYITIDKVRFPLMRKVFDLYLTGHYTVPEIKSFMDDWGYLTKPRPKGGNRPMATANIYNALKNPRYAGQIPDPYEEGVMYKANFQPMITWDEYERVQKLLGVKGRTKYVSKKQFELKGLVKCGECGCSITAERKTKTLKDRTVKSYNYYHCTGKRPCGQKGVVSESALFEQLNELLDQYEITPELYEWGLSAIKDIAKQEIEQRDDIQKVQFMTIEKIQKKLDHLLELVTEEVISSEDYKQKTESLKCELAERQDEQKEAARRAKNWYEIIGMTLEKLNNVTHNFTSGDFGARRDILLAIGYNPILLDKKLLITPNEWMKPIKNELPALKVSLEKVRTDPQQLRKSSKEAIIANWYPGLGSNQRPEA